MILRGDDYHHNGDPYDEANSPLEQKVFYSSQQLKAVPAYSPRHYLSEKVTSSVLVGKIVM